MANGLSRVYLGVHWSFDAFALKMGSNTQPDLNQNIGGVKLGFDIAKDIFASKMAKANQSAAERQSPPLPPLLP
jgi:hypothetical protein